MYGYTALSEAKYMYVLYLVCIMYVVTHSSMHPSTPRGSLLTRKGGYVYVDLSSNLQTVCTPMYMYMHV